MICVADALFAVVALAQPLLTLSGPSSVHAGQPFTVTVTLSNSSTVSLAGLQWSYVLPAGAGLGTPSISPAFAALGLGVYCHGYTCLVVGLTSAGVVAPVVMVDGVVATMPITFRPSTPLGKYQIGIVGTLGASPIGSAVTVSGAPFTIKVLKKRSKAPGK